MVTSAVGMHKNQLWVVPHPLSPCQIKIFTHNHEAEIVDRVMAVAARLAPTEPQPLRPARAAAVSHA